MDPTEPSDRLKWIFEEACRIPETDRPAFLDRVCGGNSGLRQQVVELLERPVRTQVWDDGAGPEGTIVADGPGLVRMARDLTDRAHGVLQSGAEIDGKYRIDRLIGQGGMGVVYRATQISLERAVALKVLTSALVIDEGARQRFEREAVAMARLKHPNIVSIYDFGVSTDAGAYFVMEMLDGRSLADELRARGRLSIERTARLLGQACQAVQAAHDSGIIHRDLKPDNIFLEIGPRGTEIVKVLDFGIAKLQRPDEEEADQITLAGALIGTPSYMSPEQCRGERLGTRSDIYSLGCVAYQCLTGYPPFSGRSSVQLILQHISEAPRPPSSIESSLPGAIDDVVLRALAKAPADRFASVGELEAELRRASGVEPSAPTYVTSGSSLPTGAETSSNVLPLHNLTESLTSFVSREAELDELVDAIGAERLVTLVGPGGIGKSRLAIEAGRRLLGSFSDGVWMIDLKPHTDGVLRAIASALGVKEEQDRPLVETLGIALRDRSALVIVDTCEHLVGEVASAVDSLLRAAPRLRLLAASREALNVGGESLRHVRPLDLPDVDRPNVSTADLLACGSVRLFVDRARSKRQTLELTPPTLEAIARLCARLDGIPLAIELAASRVGVMSVEQILSRMDDRFALLTSGGRSGRQPALRATVDWSYGLLSEPERVLLQRLSVFAGGCTLEAAEAVCAGEAIDTTEILDVVESLIDKSLVMVSERDDHLRYRMLETIREYAADKLDSSGREREVRERFFSWLLTEVEETRIGITTGTGQKKHLARCDREYDNIRAGLRWAIRDGRDVIGGLSLSAKLCHFWDMRSRGVEGLEWLLAAQDAAAGLPPCREIAAVTFSTGFLFGFVGNPARALEQYERSLDVATAIDDPVAVATALDGKGDALIFLGRFDEAEACIRSGIQWRTTRKIGRPNDIVTLEFNLGLVSMERGDYEVARERFEATLVQSRDFGDEWRTTLMLHNLGEVGLRLDDLPYARRRFEEAEATAERIGFRKLVNYSRIGLGLTLALLGDAVGGRDRVAEGLVESHATGEHRAIAFGLEAMAVVAMKSGQLRSAIVIESSVRAMERRGEISTAESERVYYAGLVEPARKALGDDAPVAAGEGLALSIDEALRLALTVGGTQQPD